MAHTFDIRFARAAGLAGLFDSPRNSFGRRGGGLLSIDARGISVMLKRGLVSLLARNRSQRIPAESIREVYREGEALRVEFTTGENARVTLPFWAPDRATAEKIVQLLPTTRTIEVEQETAASREGKGDGNKGWILAAGLVLVVAGGAMIASFDRNPAVELQVPEVVAQVPEISPTSAASEAPPTAKPAAGREEFEGVPLTPEQARRKALFYDTPEVPAASTSRQPDAETPAAQLSALPRDTASPRAESPGAATNAAVPRGDTTPPIGAEPEVEAFVPDAVQAIRVSPAEAVVPLPQGTLAFAAGSGMLANFEAEAARLREKHLQDRQQFESGDLSRREFVRRLQSLQSRWRLIGLTVREKREWQDSELTGMRGLLQAVAGHQVRYYDGYVAGLAGGGQKVIDQALADLKRADEFLEAARRYVR